MKNQTNPQIRPHHPACHRAERLETSPPPNRLGAVILALACLASPFSGLAETLVWTGSTSSDWQTAANWTPAQVPGASDTVVINSGFVIASADAQFSTLYLGGGTLSGPLTVASGATMNWSAGNIDGNGVLSVLPGGLLNLSGSDSKNLYGGLTNAGTVVWTDTGALTTWRPAGARIVNLAGGVFEARNDSTFADPQSDTVFANAGLLRKTASTGTTLFNGMIFNNTGTLEVQTGTVEFDKPGTSSGIFNLAAGATVHPRNDFTFDASHQFVGLGTNLWLNGTITVNGVMQWNQFLLVGATLTGTCRLAGKLDWTAGNIDGNGALSVLPGGLLNLSGPNSKNLYGGLTNAGTVVWTDTGALTTWRPAGARIVNLAGGVFEARNDSTFADPQSDTVFANAGLLRKTASTGTTLFNGMIFNNTGTLEVQTGTVQFDAPGTSSGTFNLAAGTTVYPRTDFTFDASHQFVGLGTNLWLNGTITVNGVMQSNLFLLAGATLTGTCQLAGELDWSAGSINSSGALTVLLGGLLNLSGSDSKNLYGGLTNAGTVVWTDTGALTTWQPAGARIVNLAGGVFEARNDSSLADGQSGTVFANAGLLRKTASMGTTLFTRMIFNNTGTLEVQTGTVEFDLPGTSSGTFTLAAGATVHPRTDFTFDAGQQFVGDGTNLWNTGLITANGILQSNHFLLSGATLIGTNLLMGEMNWSSGTLGDNSSLVVKAEGTLSLSGSGPKYLLGGLNNEGTILWTGAGVLATWGARGAAIINWPGGVFDIQGDARVAEQQSGSVTVFANCGLLRKTAGAGSTAFDVLFKNYGQVEALSGTLNFSRDYITSLGSLLFGLSGDSTFGRVQVTGTATLEGALGVRLLNGYLPPLGATFRVMTFGDCGGVFTDYSGLDPSSQCHFTPVFTANTMDLTVAAFLTITTQPRSQTNLVATTANFSVAAVGTAPLRYQWLCHGTNLADSASISGACTSSLTISSVQFSDAGDYAVVITNSSGAVTSTVATLTVRSRVTLDSFTADIDSYVKTVIVQPDGKLIVGGFMDSVRRLQPEGNMDTGFTNRNPTFSLALQEDGKVLVGDFHHLSRFNADGTLDTAFGGGHPIDSDSAVFCLLVLSNRYIAAGGNMSHFGDGDCGGFVTPDGLGPIQRLPCGYGCLSLAELPTGQIVMANRALSAYPPFTTDMGTNGNDGYMLAPQPDGKLLLGLGDGIRRFSPDGQLDTSFTVRVGMRPVNFNDPVSMCGLCCLAAQADGKILVGGSFTNLAGHDCNNLGRLNADGSFDPTFDHNLPIGEVFSLTVQADGKILAGGCPSFTDSGQDCYLFRLNNTEPATQTLNCNGSTITWLRGGASPEVWRSLFEVSTDGANWLTLGGGTRIPGGWQLTNVSVPPTATLRARGYLTSGQDNGSSWYVESTMQPGTPQTAPTILVNDGSFGFKATGFGFNISATVGQTVVVEGSINLVDWVPLQTNTLSGSLFYFSDPNTSASPSRFYRARLAR